MFALRADRLDLLPGLLDALLSHRQFGASLLDLLAHLVALFLGGGLSLALDLQGAEQLGEFLLLGGAGGARLDGLLLEFPDLAFM